MPLTLDLAQVPLKRVHGDIICVFTYIGEDDERCMILLPANNRQCSWFVVCDSAAYKYDDSENGDVYLWQQSILACQHLQIEPTKANIYRIAKIINDGLMDLVQMKPKKEYDQERLNIGSVTLKANGEVVAQEDFSVPKVTTEATYV